MSGSAEPLPVPGRALTIGAHPDDAEFGIGGTLARWTGAGCEAVMLIVTDGSKGTWEAGQDPAELVRIRRAEQREAAEVLGVSQVVFLEHVDGELEYGMGLREELCLWIRRLRPEVVASHDPWRRYMLHPDHRATGWGAVDGVVAARDHLFFPHQLQEGLSAHRPDWLLLWSADEADHWEDISGTFERKVEALLRHRSQSASTMGDADQGDHQLGAFRERLRAWAASQGEPAGLEAAEAFRRLQP